MGIVVEKAGVVEEAEGVGEAVGAGVIAEKIVELVVARIVIRRSNSVWVCVGTVNDGDTVSGDNVSDSEAGVILMITLRTVLESSLLATIGVASTKIMSVRKTIVSSNVFSCLCTNVHSL